MSFIIASTGLLCLGNGNTPPAHNKASGISLVFIIFVSLNEIVMNIA